MDIFALLAAFGGGVLGASIGALPAFIMTGVVCLIGQGAGTPNGGGLVSMAFGSMFGPHIAFAGGVAAAAYAGKVGKLENGADIATAGFGLGDPMVLLVGGLFGILGFLIHFGWTQLFNLGIPGTDLPGITVFTSGIIARLVFGKRGILSGGERKALSSGTALTNTLLVAFGYSLCVGGVYVGLAESGVIVEGYNVVCFGIAAVGLLFAEFGQAYFGCHHIMIISAMAVSMAYPTMGAFGAMIVAVVCGIVSALLCDFETNFINTDVDSHIDGPAFAIFIMTIVVNAIFG